MSLNKLHSFLFLSIFIIFSFKRGDAFNFTVELQQSPSLSPAPAASAAANVDGGSFPVFKPAGEPISPLSLLSSFPEDLEISDYCTELLQIFGQRYVTYVNCLVPAARPVKVCQKCFSSYGSVVEIYTNISDHVRTAHTQHRVLFMFLSQL